MAFSLLGPQKVFVLLQQAVNAILLRLEGETGLHTFFPDMFEHQVLEISFLLKICWEVPKTKDTFVTTVLFYFIFKMKGIP